MEKKEFSRALLKWYAANKRLLPWRDNPDPYAVWISEAMLQQTRVDTVIPYFQRWMGCFPSVESLAHASEEDVLNAWEGLGYYTRARNLRKAAHLLCEKFQGILPQSMQELRALPGIGQYTAAAIASMAFGQNEAVVDGNVKRVLARVFNLEFDANTPDGESAFWRFARELLPAGSAGDYNQAIMDFGATLCTPRAPLCGKCPIASTCKSNLLGIQTQRPVLREKKPVPHHLVCAAVLIVENKALIARRPSRGLLGGMWEFPGGKVEPGETKPQALEREIFEELGTHVNVGDELGKYRHAYTHFRITLHAFFCTLNGEEPRALDASEIRWVPIPDLVKFPMGKVDRLISNDLKNRLED
jgi:A/G-specific adenine glycosylase